MTNNIRTLALNKRARLFYHMKKICILSLCFYRLAMIAQNQPIKRHAHTYDSGFDHKNNSSNFKNPHYWFNKGLKDTDAGNFDEALADFTKALNLDSAYADAYNYRGLVKCHFFDYYKAIMDFDKAIFFNPKEAANYNNRGAVFEEINMLEAAIKDYRKAVTLSPHIKRYTENLDAALAKYNSR